MGQHSEPWQVHSTMRTHLISQLHWISLNLMLLIPAGFLLDIFFGMTFFTFENRQATLGWNLPGYKASLLKAFSIVLLAQK